jgi:omega-6 fatty acid desaturase (delta-12 desaturase)
MNTSAMTPPLPDTAPGAAPNWRKIVKKYQVPCLKKSLWQIANSMGSYIALWIVMYFTVSVSWPLTLGLATLAGMFLVRVFIIFHDCGHGSFFSI